MPVLDIAKGQRVSVPAIHLTSGEPMEGVVKASDGENLVVALEPGVEGRIPSETDDMCVLTWEKDGIQRACPVLVRQRTPRALIGQVVIQERREAPRLRVDIQITYEPLAAAQVKEAADAVMARVREAAGLDSETARLLHKDEDPLDELRAEIRDLRGMLQDVLLRLDNLTAIVTGGQPSQGLGPARRPLSLQNCSSSGVGIVTEDYLGEGTYLRMRLNLHTVPQTTIDLIGVVVRCTRLETSEPKEHAPRYDVGVRYTHIHESDRERLIHYLFKVQRRMLRERREQRDVLEETV